MQKFGFAKRAAAVLAFGFSALAYGAPSDASLARLGDLMPYESVFLEAVMAPVAEEGQMLLYGLANDESLSDEQRQKAAAIFDEYAQNLIQSLDTPANKAALKQAYLAAAKKHYTQAEVDAQLAFYGSAAGQSALEKQGEVLDSYMQQVSSIGANALKKYQEDRTAMQDRIKQALNK